jgi:hypothetical protein
MVKFFEEFRIDFVCRARNQSEFQFFQKVYERLPVDAAITRAPGDLDLLKI